MKLTHIKHPDGNTFLTRVSCHFGKGSLKFHIIRNDDIKYHTHPWDFKSLILFGGYREHSEMPIGMLWPEFFYPLKTYGFLSVNRKQANVSHKIVLKRFLGIKIWAVTIGWYGKKKQLCSLCQEQGYCRTEREREQRPRGLKLLKRLAIVLCCNCTSRRQGSRRLRS